MDIYMDIHSTRYAIRLNFDVFVVDWVGGCLGAKCLKFYLIYFGNISNFYKSAGKLS